MSDITLQHTPLKNLRAGYHKHCGHGVGPNWKATIKALNRDLGLGWNKPTRRVMTILNNHLGDVIRFKGEDHLIEALGDSTAAHQISTALTIDDAFKRLFDVKEQGDTVTLSEEMNAKRIEAIMEALTHDQGELLGEFTTVANQTNGVTLTSNEKGAMEEAIFKWVLVRAARVATIEDKTQRITARANLNAKIINLSQKLNIKNLGVGSAEAVEAWMNSDSYKLPKLTDAAQAVFDDIWSHYQTVEIDDPTFMQAYVKLEEKMDGSKYFLSREGITLQPGAEVLSYKYANSAHVMFTLRRMQKGVHPMVEMADSEDELKLAGDVLHRNYALAIKSIDKTTNLLDRTAKPDGLSLQRDAHDKVEKSRADKIFEYKSEVIAQRSGTKFEENARTLFERNQLTKREAKLIFETAQELGIVPPKGMTMLDLTPNNMPTKFTTLSKGGQRGEVSSGFFINALVDHAIEQKCTDYGRG